MSSSVTNEDLVNLRARYEIPNNIVLSNTNMLGKVSKPSGPCVGHIALSLNFFAAGLRILFPLPIRRLLGVMNVPPSSFTCTPIQ